MTGRIALVLLASLLLAAAGLQGCRDDEPAKADAPGASGRLERAEARLREELLATARELGAAGEPVRSEPAPCREKNLDPKTLEPTGPELFTAGLRLELDGANDALLDAAEARWRRAGHRVRRRHTAFPAVFATTSEGYTYSVQLLPEQDRAVLAGGTPCLPR